jgi:hypothetical protein
MNWLERARREIQENAQRSTANSAERTPMAVMAVPHPALCEKLNWSTGSNGSIPLGRSLESEVSREDFEERAAIMEFDGGLAREEAERAAWASISMRHENESEELQARPDRQDDAWMDRA